MCPWGPCVTAVSDPTAAPTSRTSHIHAHVLRHSHIGEWGLILIDRHGRRDCRLLAVKADTANRINGRSILTLPVGKPGRDFLEICRAKYPLPAAAPGFVVVDRSSGSPCFAS